MEEIIENELWRDVPGYQRYECSSLGRLRLKSNGRIKSKNYSRRTGRFFIRLYPDEATRRFYTSPRRGKYGRLKYGVYGRQIALTSRLLALAFYGDPPTRKHQVDHIDCDKTNERVSNLEWVTPAENVRRSYANGRHDNDSRKINWQTEAAYEGIKAMVRSGVSQVKTAQHFGIHNTTVSKIMAGKINPKYKTVSETL